MSVSQTTLPYLALAALVSVAGGVLRDKNGRQAAPSHDIRAAGEARLAPTTKQGGGSALVSQQLAVRGIKNLGNTCFLNAVLQSLGSFPVFREYLEVSSM